MSVFTRGEERIAIMRIPERKHKVLAIGKDNVFQPIASFTSDESADQFEEMLDRWFRAKRKD